MFRASVAILLTLAAGVRAQSTVTAKEAFLVQADAGVVGGYGFVAYPGQPKALTFKAGGPAYAVVLGGSSAGAVTPLMPDAGSNALGGTPDLLILATDSAYWGAFYQLLQVQPSTYALGPDNFGQAAHVTRDSGGRLRLMSYSAGVKLSRVTSAATLSSTGAITVAAPAVAGFLGKWLLSPPGSDLIYEWTDGWSQVRIADYSAVNPVFGNPYPVSGVQRARLYWAGGTTTYVVFTEGTTISIVQLGSSSVIPMGNFEVQLPGGAPSCPGCILTDLEIAQEGFPGYPDGAIIAVIANKSSAALLALVDWADVATLLNLGTRASTASAALLDPAAGGGGGGGGGGGPGGPVGAGGPYVGGSSSSGCSSSGGVMPPLQLAALLLGWALSRRSPSVR
ncbi:MAG TPA: MYXO-CTERM sorting domain-containing protein [Myxococcaceae bacterium]